MGKRTIRDAIVGFIDSAATSEDFWAPLENKKAPQIHLTQINNYFIQENGKPKLVKRELLNEEGEIIDVESNLDE